MIGKIMKNHSFRATTRYVLEKEQAEIIGGNMVDTQVDGIVSEFMMSKSLNPEIERPVYHLTQSYSYDDKKPGLLNQGRLEMLATRHFAGMIVSTREPKLLDQPELFRKQVNQFLKEDIHHYSFFVAAHHDTGHIHTHLVASRISLEDGKCIPTWYERIRTQKVCRILEQQFGLEQLENTRDIKKPNQVTRDRMIQTAPVMERWLNQEKVDIHKGDHYTLLRQGATLTYRRQDGSVALKAYKNKQGKWKARRGDLTEQECQDWQKLNQEMARASQPIQPSTAQLSPSKRSQRVDHGR